MEFRNARHTDNLERIESFYTNVMGLTVLFSFEDHNGYSGIMLGKEAHDWHLEFTTSRAKAEHTFDAEDILVFYPTHQEEYDEIIYQIEANNLETLTPGNPYWYENGIMIQDPDGFRVIISNLKIK